MKGLTVAQWINLNRNNRSVLACQYSTLWEINWLYPPTAGGSYGEEVSMNCTAYTYYITLIAKCMCIWLSHLLKLLPSMLLPCTDSSQPGWFHGETYMRVLGLVEYDDRLEDCFIMYWFKSRNTKYVTFYAWTNRLTYFSTCNPPIQLLLCINKLFLTSAWQHA